MIVSFHKNIILRFNEMYRDRAVVGGDDGSRNASTVTKKKTTKFDISQSINKM